MTIGSASGESQISFASSKVPGPAWLLLAYPLPPGDPYSPTLTYFSMLEDISAYSQILMRHGTKCLNSSTSKSSYRANTLCAGRTLTIPHHLSYYTHKIGINYLSFHFYPSTIPLSSLIISLFIMTSPPIVLPALFTKVIPHHKLFPLFGYTG